VEIAIDSLLLHIEPMFLWCGSIYFVC